MRVQARVAASAAALVVEGVLIQERSRIHHGALLLDVHGSPANRLIGWCWTDRDTKGEVTLEKRVSKAYTSFDEASAATSE